MPRRELAGGDGQLLLHNHLSTTDNMLELIFRRHLGKKNAFTTAEAPGRASPSRKPKMQQNKMSLLVNPRLYLSKQDKSCWSNPTRIHSPGAEQIGSAKRQWLFGDLID